MTLQEPLLATAPLRFTVYGHAMPGGSKVPFIDPHSGQARVKEDSKNMPWRQEVAGAGLYERLRAPWGDHPAAVPLIVDFTFYRPRPKSHYGTGRNAGILKGNAPIAPGTRPDVLKLARAVEDALTGILWVDDSLICVEHLVKCWGEPERVEITVAPL